MTESFFEDVDLARVDVGDGAVLGVRCGRMRGYGHPRNWLLNWAVLHM